MPALSSLESKTYAKVDWRLIPFLFLCYILAYLDRVNVGFAKLQMTKDLSLSDAAFATGAGIFFIGYFLFEVPSNILLKRFGARAWIARIMISWGVVSACMLFVRSEWVFYAMRFVLGIVEAGFFPGIIFYLTLWYPSRLRSTRTALFVSAIAVAGVIGNPISGAIIDALSGKAGLAGWQWLFLIEGIPSFVVGGWVFFSSIRDARWLTPEQKELLERNLLDEEQHKTEARLVDAFKEREGVGALRHLLHAHDRAVRHLLLAADHRQGLRREGLPRGRAHHGHPILRRGRRDDVLEPQLRQDGRTTPPLRRQRQPRRARAHPQWRLRVEPALAIVFLSIGTLGVIGSMPVFWPIPSAFLTGTASAAGIGLVNSIGNLGGYVGPNLPVWAKAFSSDPSAALYAIAFILLVGAIITYFAIPKSLHVRVGEAPIPKLRDERAGPAPAHPARSPI
jgi:MFS family permease